MSRILVSAAEPSADRYIARLIPALRSAWPHLAIDAIGGPATAGTGVSMLTSMDHLQAFGLVEAVRGLPVHLRLLRDLRAALRRGAWDLVILCDYPGWHLRVGRAAREAGVPVLYYVAPQLWAWGAWRAAALRRATTSIAAILPFEETFFRAHGVTTRFVGHPLLDEPQVDRTLARRALGVAQDASVIAVLPGARPNDLARHWPLFHGAILRIGQRRPDVVCVVGGAPGRTYAGWSGPMAAGGRVALAAADVALLKSGTATIEAALADVPAVVSYRMHPATWLIARRAVRLPWVSLANLVAERPVHPELLQSRATPEGLAGAVLDLLGDQPAQDEQRRAYATVRERLGTAGAANRVAAMARELVA